MRALLGRPSDFRSVPTATTPMVVRSSVLVSPNDLEGEAWGGDAEAARLRIRVTAGAVTVSSVAVTSITSLPAAVCTAMVRSMVNAVMMGFVVKIAVQAFVLLPAHRIAMGVSMLELAVIVTML